MNTIPFPNKRAAPKLDNQAKLDLALVNLLAALDEQKKAVTLWRASLAKLKVEVSKLENSYQAFNENLSVMQTCLDTIRETSSKTLKVLEESGF